MWPDDDRLVQFADGALEPDLQDLADTLSAAGQRARRRASVPSRAFAADLRTRLVDESVSPRRSALQGTATMDRVRPRVVAREAATFRVPRWSVAAVAAALVIAVVGIDGGWLDGGPAETAVVGATDAVLVRDGTRAPLEAGMQLHEGDRLLTGADGSATLALAGGETRLAASTDLTIDDISGTEVVLEQAAGRAWHRVDDPLERYVVTTGDVTWTATGTAFDLDRRPADRGGEEVRAIGIEHDVTAIGPGLAVSVTEGTIAIVALGPTDGARRVRLDTATTADLADTWLRWNATRDLALGFDIGVLEPELAQASERPKPTPTSVLTPRPTGDGDPRPSAAPTAVPTAVPTSEPTPRSTPKPTPKPTAKPTPKPTPTPTPSLASLGLDVTSCDGGFAVLDWTTAPAEGFGHYQSLRSTSSSIAPAYPPKAPALAPDGLYTTDRLALRGTDTGLEPGTAYWYRTLALTAGDDAYAASPVRAIEARPIKALGALAWSVEAGTVTFEWLAYGGPQACFGIAKLVVSQTDDTPGYLEGGSNAVWASEDQAAAGAVLDGFTSGTHFARLEILRDTWIGKVLVARTDVATIVVP